MIGTSSRFWTRSLIACSTTTVSASYIFYKPARTTACEKQHHHKANAPFRVLIVGSGLTGSLTALRLRHRLTEHLSSTDIPLRLDLHVVERATYPAGRFGAAAIHGGVAADIGAQVLSTVNPRDERARVGHGIALPDLWVAEDILRGLIGQGLVRRISDARLGSETEERMIWEGLWEHHAPTTPGGLRGVLCRLLETARVKPCFGVRVDGVVVRGEEVHVKGTARKSCANADVGTTVSQFSEFLEVYDCVVFCIPAPDVLEIKGLQKYLSSESLHVLKNVRYDRRMCEAHFFSEKMRPALKALMQRNVEMKVNDINNKLQYIAWQDQKWYHGISERNPSPPCAVVVHGPPDCSLEPLGDALDSTLSSLTGMAANDIAACRVFSKTIPWKVAQMVTPMEAVVGNPPTAPLWQCLVGGNGKIVLAGDFMTHSSYLGCIASADAAARAVVKTMICHRTEVVT